MQTLERGAIDLYWLAFLVTGHREQSLNLTIEAFDSNNGADSFFSSWMLAWSRRVVISKALAAIARELAASARSTICSSTEKAELPPRDWALDRDTTKAQLESALLAVDVFPRCALLLCVFEGISLVDAAILLDSGLDLVRKAQAIGLQQLTGNLARMQGWTSIPTQPYVITSEIEQA